MRIWIVVAAACFGGPVRGICEEPPSMVIESISGKWKLQSYTCEGQEKSGSDLDTTFHGQRIQLAKNQWVEWYTESPAPPAAKTDDTPFRFQATTAKPFGHFDYWPVGPDGKPSAWKKVGIYKLEGERLTICFRVQEIPGPLIKRPTRFDASKGTYAGLAVYQSLGANE